MKRLKIPNLFKKPGPVKRETKEDRELKIEGRITIITKKDKAKRIMETPKEFVMDFQMNERKIYYLSKPKLKKTLKRWESKKRRVFHT